MSNLFQLTDYHTPKLGVDAKRVQHLLLLLETRLFYQKKLVERRGENSLKGYKGFFRGL